MEISFKKIVENVKQTQFEADTRIYSVYCEDVRLLGNKDISEKHPIFYQKTTLIQALGQIHHFVYNFWYISRHPSRYIILQIAIIQKLHKSRTVVKELLLSLFFRNLTDSHLVLCFLNQVLVIMVFLLVEWHRLVGLVDRVEVLLLLVLLLDLVEVDGD